MSFSTCAIKLLTNVMYCIFKFSCPMLPYFFGTHFSKHLSDLKQNGTQEKTPFSSTVFNALSHGVIRFDASVSSKKTTLWLFETLRQPIRSFYSVVFEANTRNKTKRSTPYERVWKWCLFLCAILFQVTWAFCKM